MPISEQRMKQVEEKLIELDTRTRIGALNLDDLTNRVDAISQSLTRLEEKVTDFLDFWQSFLVFLRRAVMWMLSILSVVVGGVVVWYITTHLFR